MRALVGPRNHAVHGTDLVEPDVVNALGPIPDTGSYVILPRWRPASSVPTSMFEFKGTPRPSYRAAYVAAAEGRSVFDTFLDAFAFFEKCDPGVVERDGDNQIAGFPLPPLPIANRYRRLHPDWPTEHEWNETERVRILAAPPGGLRRVVHGRIPATDGPLLCGLTVVTEQRGSLFVEPVSQVVRDLTAGYRYISEQHPDRTDLLCAAGDRVVLPGEPDLTTLPDLAGDTRPWLAWRDLCLDDADYYRRQREQAIPRRLSRLPVAGQVDL